MSFPLRIPDQLTQHLRAMRKRRGLTQAGLGALVGVGQARIAEIEANPGVVSLDQIVNVLAALGGTLHIHGTGAADAESATEPSGGPKTPQSTPTPAATATPKPAPQASSGPARRRSATSAAGPAAARAAIVIRPNKGTW